MTTDDDAAGAEATLPATPIPNVLPAGTRVGDFEITGLVGEGGFGIVYRAFDHTLHRNVALKEYMPNALARRRADLGVTLRAPQYEATFKAGLKSFVNEARLLAQFDHPALVKVFRFWEANDSAYMVMPLYEGRTLKAVLRGMPHPDEAWLKGILAPLLDALETLHGARCYHRDVAPDNILILDSGGPLLLDFGAARRIIGNMTQAVTVIIKPGYAPVEQYADDPAFTQGPWTDIYALAAVMRFAITGKPPATSVTRMVTDPVRPLAEVATGYSAGFLAALDRGLAVRPEDRPQSIAEFRELLGLEGYGISQPRSMPLAQAPTAPPASAAAPAAPSTAASIAPAAPAPPAAPPRGPILGTGTHTVPFRALSGEPPPTSSPAAAAAEPSVPVPSAPPPAIDVQEPKRAAPFAAPTPRPPSAAIATSASVPWTPILVVAGALAAVIAGGYFVMQSLAPKPTGVGARIRAESAPTAPAPAKAPAATDGAATGAPAGTPPTSASAAPAPGLPATVAAVEPPKLRAEPVPVPPIAAPAAPPATAAPTPVSPVAAPAAPPATAAPAPASPVALAAAPPATAAPPPASRVAVPPVPSPGAVGAAALTPPQSSAAPAAPPTGRLVLNVKPWGEVFVDGRSRGPSPPLKTLVLPEGKHRIEIRNPAATAALVQDVEIKAGRNVSLTHAFK